MEGKLAAYGTDYMSMGAGDIQRRVAGKLVAVLQQQLDTPRLWSVAARLATLYAKTFPGSDGTKAVSWYRMAADVAGDLNVDFHSAKYDALLRNADLAPADSRTGHPYSFDTQENSVAKYRYPDDPREDLDYVLHRNGHARPAGWQNTVIKEESAPWTVSSWGKEYTYTNLSDHYPLAGG